VASRAVARAASDPFDPLPGAWKTHEITTQIDLQAGGPAQAWVPVPCFTEASWMRPGTTTFHGDAATARIVTVSQWNVSMVHAQWNASPQPRKLTVVSLITTRNRDVDLARGGTAAPLSAQERALYTASTDFIPTGGIVKETAHTIVQGASGDLDKARRIYAWVVEKTYRKASTRGCGVGDVAFLLQSGNLGGKCADINGLTVGLARAAGIPARDLYGVRIAPSAFGYKSLGANTPDITHAQHCRAELYLESYGWVPVDPADVRKVMLEEPPGNLSPENSKVVDARKTLFGAWEGNYMAYNSGADIPLPGSAHDPVPFFMYPQGEIDGARLDSLDPADFAYVITSRPVAPA
jgi:transglutaminase-like putative cysteine protease